jgi:hypothetical protein
MGKRTYILEIKLYFEYPFGCNKTNQIPSLSIKELEGMIIAID